MIFFLTCNLNVIFNNAYGFGKRECKILICLVFFSSIYIYIYEWLIINIKRERDHI
jgi:hypothetical protein